jgi:hypothetical protein
MEAYYVNRLFDSFVANPNAFIHNVNFKPMVLAQLFDALYLLEEPKGDEKRLKQIRSLSESIKQMKPDIGQK